MTIEKQKNYRVYIKILKGGEKMNVSIVGGYIEVYFDDLNEEAKKMFLGAMGLDSEEDGNYDVVPITTIAIPERYEEEGK